MPDGADIIVSRLSRLVVELREVLMREDVTARSKLRWYSRGDRLARRG